nr:hypothetical protein [uncultured Ruegeria sp.]
MSNMNRAHAFYGDLIAYLEIAETQAKYNNFDDMYREITLILNCLYSQKQSSNRHLPATKLLDADERIIDIQWGIERMTDAESILKSLRSNIEGGYEAAVKQHRIYDTRDSLSFFSFGARSQLNEEPKTHHGREYQCCVQAITAAEKLQKIVC